MALRQPFFARKGMTLADVRIFSYHEEAWNLEELSCSMRGVQGMVLPRRYAWLFAIAMLLGGRLELSGAEDHPQKGAMRRVVDRIALVVGREIVTLRQLEELEAYLRYRAENSRLALSLRPGESLHREAVEEAITRALVLQKFRQDPEFRIACGRASEELDERIRQEGESACRRRLAPYGLSVARFRKLEGLTLAIQNYVQNRFHRTIEATPVQIDQYIKSHPNLEAGMRQLSEASQQEVRAVIARQIAFRNFLDRYEEFVEQLRSDVEILEVYLPWKE